jgi:hypothetical protein
LITGWTGDPERLDRKDETADEEGELPNAVQSAEGETGRLEEDMAVGRYSVGELAPVAEPARRARRAI